MAAVEISGQHSEISLQRSAVGIQHSAVSYQLCRSALCAGLNLIATPSKMTRKRRKRPALTADG
jgi:hypothetical protein